MSARVVITGMSGISSLGDDWETVRKNMKTGRSGIQYMQDWTKYDGLNTLLGGPVNDFEVPEHYTRKRIRAGRSTALRRSLANCWNAASSAAARWWRWAVA